MMYGSQYAHNVYFGRCNGDNLMYDAEGEVTKTGSVYSHDLSDCDSDDLETELTTAREMRDEGKRLMTFSSWPPSSNQLPEILAEAGFFYTGSIDRVKCAYCLGILKKWQPEDMPFVEHQKHFPYCRFIQGEDVGNIPLRQSGIEQVPEISSEVMCSASTEKREKLEDIKPSSGMKVSTKLSLLAIPARGPTGPPPQQCQRQISSNLVYENLTLKEPPKYTSNQSIASSASSFVPLPETLTVTPLKKPRTDISTTDYTFEANRVATFLRWPADSGPSPEVVARAGFYHVPTEGKPDRVKCGYCGGKLFGWQKGDNPMVEHARCFPDCPYMKMCSEEGRLNITPERVPAMCSSSNASEQIPTSSKTFENDSNFGPNGDITTVMRSDIVHRVLAMGFPQEKLVKVIRQRKLQGRQLSVEDLVEAVLEMK